MTDLLIRSRSLLVSMGGASSAKSVSNTTTFALQMCFGGIAKVIVVVKTANTIVYESVIMKVITDYDYISTTPCIGTSIQSHGPPMVDINSFLHSSTVFAVDPQMSYQYKTNNFLKNISRCG